MTLFEVRVSVFLVAGETTRYIFKWTRINQHISRLPNQMTNGFIKARRIHTVSTKLNSISAMSTGGGGEVVRGGGGGWQGLVRVMSRKISRAGANVGDFSHASAPCCCCCCCWLRADLSRHSLLTRLYLSGNHFNKSNCVLYHFRRQQQTRFEILNVELTIFR